MFLLCCLLYMLMLFVPIPVRERSVVVANPNLVFSFAISPEERDQSARERDRRIWKNQCFRNLLAVVRNQAADAERLPVRLASHAVLVQRPVVMSLSQKQRCSPEVIVVHHALNSARECHRLLDLCNPREAESSI